MVAAIAAYDHGDGWLAALLERLGQQRALLASLLAGLLSEERVKYPSCHVPSQRLQLVREVRHGVFREEDSGS